MGELIYSDQEVRQYMFFRTIYDPSFALYPCCEWDASPARAFERVRFVDLNSEIMEAFQAEGLDAVCCDIDEYEPEELHDLLLLIRPQIPFNLLGTALKHLKPGGYLITDNHHMIATTFLTFHADQYKLVGTIEGEHAFTLLTDPDDVRGYVMANLSSFTIFQQKK